MDDKLLVLIILLIFYAVGVLTFFIVAYNIKDNFTSKYVRLSQTGGFFKRHKTTLIIIISFTWMVSWLFLLWCCIDIEVHNRYLAKKRTRR